MMLPVIDALTSSTCPSCRATIAMISSAALPKVALRKPPSAGPERARQLLGAGADQAGQRDQRQRRGQEHPRSSRATSQLSTHDAGAATSSRLSRLETIGFRAVADTSGQSANFSRSSSSAPGSRSKKASRLRSSARRSWGMVPSMVWRVTPEVSPSLKRHLRVVEPFHRAFRDEPDAVDEGVTSHPAIVSSLPAARLAREPRRQRRLGFRLRFRLSRRDVDLPFEIFFVGQAGELVHEHQRVLRRDLEFLAAGLARDLVVEAEQVVAQLGELGPVALVGPGRQPLLLRAPHPADAVFAGPPALGALIPSGPGFRFFGEKRAFVESHTSW